PRCPLALPLNSTLSLSQLEFSWPYETNVHDPRRRILGRPIRAATTGAERLDTSQGHRHRFAGDRPRKPPHCFAASKIRERLLAGEIRRAAGFAALPQLVYVEQGEAECISG